MKKVVEVEVAAEPEVLATSRRDQQICPDEDPLSQTQRPLRL